MITRGTIVELLRRQPFNPFELHLSSGEVYRVRHPEVAAIGKSELVVVDPETDQKDYIGLLHVASVKEMRQSVRKPHGRPPNGKD